MAVDWSRFTPVAQPGVAPPPDEPVAPAVDWSKFTPVEPRGALAEIGTGLKRGVPALQEMGGQALKYVSEPGNAAYETGQEWTEAAKKTQALADYTLHPEQHGVVVNALASGAEMALPSIVPVAAATAAAATLPFSAPIAAGLGLVAGVAPAALSQAESTYEAAKARGVKEEDAVSAARKTGATEAVGEALGTALGPAGRFVKGAFGVARKTAIKEAEALLAHQAAPGIVKPFLKELPKQFAGEVGTEIGQAYTQAEVERQAGISDVTGLEAAGQVIGPTVGLTALLTPLGLAGHAAQSRAVTRRREAIESQETDPKERAQHARRVYDELHAIDPGAATRFRENVAQAIARGQPIKLDAGILGVPVVPQAPGAVPPSELGTTPGVLPEGQPVEPGQPAPLAGQLETTPGVGPEASLGTMVSPAPPAGPISRALSQIPSALSTSLGAQITETPAEQVDQAYRDQELAQLLRKGQDEADRSREFPLAQVQQRQQQAEQAMSAGRGEGPTVPETLLSQRLREAQETADEKKHKQTVKPAPRQTGDEAAATLPSVEAGAGPSDADVARALADEQARKAAIAGGGGDLGGGAQDVAPDTRVAYSKLFPNRLESEAIGAHGFNSLNRKQQQVVLSRVSSVLHDQKVARAVVKAVPVDVMDALTGMKGAPKELLHNPTMLKDVLAIPEDSPISPAIDRFVETVATIRHAPTNARTKEAVGGVGSEPVLGKGLPTETTGKIETRHGVTLGNVEPALAGTQGETVSTEVVKPDVVLSAEQQQRRAKGREDLAKYLKTNATPEELKKVFGPSWAIARDTPANRERYGRLITPKQYRETVAEIIAKRGTPVAKEERQPSVPAQPPKANVEGAVRTAIPEPKAKEGSAKKPIASQALPTTEVAAQEEVTNEPQPEASERRTDVGRRKAISAMSKAELRAALLTDDLTGLGNRRAYDEVNRRPYQASLDLDGVAWVNDHLGHSTGDSYLKAFGTVLLSEAKKHPGVRAYRVGGDEFRLEGEARALRETISTVERRAAEEIVVEATLPDGTIIQKQGVGFSYGIARDFETADRVELQKHKAQRTAEGLRSERKTEPPGVVRRTPEGREGEIQKEAAEKRVAQAPAEGKPGGTAGKETARKELVLNCVS